MPANKPWSVPTEGAEDLCPRCRQPKDFNRELYWTMIG